MNNIKIALIVMAIALIMPFASGANSYNLEEFTKEKPVQGIILEKGDMVSFNLLDGAHGLRLKDVATSEKSIKLNVYPFTNVNASMAQAIPFFGLDNVVRVDLNQDDVDDVALDIYEIKEGKVTLIVESLAHMEESRQPEISGEAPVDQGVVEEQKDAGKWYKGIVIAVVLLAALLYYRAIHAKKRKAAQKKEE